MSHTTTCSTDGPTCEDVSQSSGWGYLKCDTCIEGLTGDHCETVEDGYFIDTDGTVKDLSIHGHYNKLF
eukprot:Awhi_evm2s2734